MVRTTLLRMSLIVALVAAFSATGQAGPIVFDGSGTVVFQQTLNNPCLIGDPSCNQPAGMTYTVNVGPGDYDLTSPVYQAVSPHTTFAGNLIPTTFRVGIDSNIATGAGPQTLLFFRTFTCTDATGTTCVLDVANSFEPDTLLPNNNNGNGFSDALLNGFTLTAGTFYKFEASVSNATDGMEEFFLIPLTSPPVVPEPLSISLLGAGLIGLFVVRRRMNR